MQKVTEASLPTSARKGLLHVQGYQERDVMQSTAISCSAIKEKQERAFYTSNLLRCHSSDLTFSLRSTVEPQWNLLSGTKVNQQSSCHRITMTCCSLHLHTLQLQARSSVSISPCRLMHSKSAVKKTCSPEPARHMTAIPSQNTKPLTSAQAFEAC